MSKPRFHSCFVSVLVVATLLVAGCGRKGSPAEQMIADANKTNLHRLCNMYTLFQSKNGGQGPGDEAEFKSFIADQGDRILTRMGIEPSNIDAIFSSDRDNEKFEILWSVSGSARDDAKPIVAEKVGVSGKRMLGFTLPVHREVDEAEYKKHFK